MQRESFRDPDVAGFLNEQFVSIKVDRELRPDVDAFYQSFVGITTGSGGWPLTVFLTPDGAPFLGGTYFPATSPHGRGSSFAETLRSVLQAWVMNRPSVMETGGQSVETLRHIRSSAREGQAITREDIDLAAQKLRDMLDPRYGGLRPAPKFPQTPVIGFLLEYHRHTGLEWPLEAARQWLDAMLTGGINDHIGGGLFRYSTDDSWTVPHFEKMLYDQGAMLLVLAATERVVRDGSYAAAARSIATFAQQALSREGGGFYSALDADTGGIEGGTYLWSYEELETVLDAEELELACSALGVTHAGDLDGMNVLRMTEAHGPRDDALGSLLEKLQGSRDAREQPPRVENTITAWNASMARGLIEAGAVFGDDAMVTAGTDVLRWLLGDVARGRDLPRTPEEGRMKTPRFLEDYAATIAACLSAVEHLDDRSMLKAALKLHRTASTRFADPEGLLMSTPDGLLPFVPLETTDTPTASGASLHAENAVRLAALTGDDRHCADVDDVLVQYTRTISLAPHLAGHALAINMRTMV